MPREFEIATLDLRRAWLLPGGILIAVFVAVAVVARRDPLVLLFLSAELLVAALLIGYAFGRRRVTVEDGKTLQVVAGIAHTRIAVADLDPDAARIVDLDAEDSLRPWIKLWGAATLGYRAGHFLLRDRSRAFVLLTTGRRVLALPRRSGGWLLLSLRRPETLLDALRAMAKPTTAR